MAGWRLYMNIEEKIKKNNIETSDPGLKIPMRRQKKWSRNWRNKLRRRQNVIEKSQSVEEVGRDRRWTLGPEQQNPPVLNWRCRIMQVDV